MPETSPGIDPSDGYRRDLDSAELRELSDFLNAADSGESKLTPAEREARTRDSERKTRMAVNEAKVKAHKEARLARAKSSKEGDVFFDKDKDGSVKSAEIRYANGTEFVSLHEILEAEDVEIKFGNKKERGVVVVDKEPVTKLEKLNLILELITAKSFKTKSHDRTDNERKIASVYEARDEVAQVLARVKMDEEMSFDEKRDEYVAAQDSYISSLGDATDALLEEFRAASERLNEKVFKESRHVGDARGLHLETVLGISDHEVEAYLENLVRVENEGTLMPYEWTPKGYKNRATGEIEDFWRNPTEMWDMYWGTNDIGIDNKFTDVLGGYSEAGKWNMTKNVSRAVMSAGLLGGALAGVGVRSVWKKIGMKPWYYTRTHGAKLVGKGVDIALKWMGLKMPKWFKTSDKVTEKKPWLDNDKDGGKKEKK